MNNEYELKQRMIPCNDSFDVIVVGGGPAGCASAIAASREEAKTLIIEATGCLGGMGTAGLVPAWCPFSDKEKIIYRGIAEKVFDATKRGMPHIENNALDWVAIDPELLKRIYDDMVLGAGVTVMFNTLLSTVDLNENGEVSAIVVSNKAGLSAYRAKVYIDCTGDADLAAWAGAEFIKGDELTGDLQAATHCFILGNVDEYAYLNGPDIHGKNPASPVYKILESGRYPEVVDSHMCNHLIGPKTVGFNAGHLWKVDNTEPVSVSRAFIQGRKIAMKLCDGLAEFHPKAFGNAFLVATGALMGIRETRRVIGDYILTVEDYLQRRSFWDEICRNSYYIDLHLSPDKKAVMTKEEVEIMGKYNNYAPGESHGIPYRCLTPKDLKNVLVAGRSISCERPVMGSIRVMPVCLATGEAAGVAAGMAAKELESNVHTINIGLLRDKLKEYGAYLPD
jgi:hypothetical protein